VEKFQDVFKFFVKGKRVLSPRERESKIPLKVFEASNEYVYGERK